MMNWPDPTAAPSQQQQLAGGQLTTVRLPVSEHPTNPYRYVLGYAHQTGYGCYVANCDGLLTDHTRIAATAAHIEQNTGRRKVGFIAMSLLAAPLSTPPLLVAISDVTDSPWRYFVSYFKGDGFGTAIMDLPLQMATEDHIDKLRAEICRQAKLSAAAILAINLMAAPR